MNDNLTDISIVLDRSGSMSTVRSDTIGGFNTFLAEQKREDGDVTLTLAQFDTDYEIVHPGIPLNDVPELTDETFVPRGMTALLDALGRTINETGARLSAMPEEQRPGRVIFVIITDGKENSSREFTKNVINSMIAHQSEVYDWDFVFIGANQDAIKSGARMGIVADNCLAFDHNAKGTREMFAEMSCSMSEFRKKRPRDKEAFFKKRRCSGSRPQDKINKRGLL